MWCTVGPEEGRITRKRNDPSTHSHTHTHAERGGAAPWEQLSLSLSAADGTGGELVNT